MSVTNNNKMTTRRQPARAIAVATLLLIFTTKLAPLAMAGGRTTKLDRILQRLDAVEQENRELRNEVSALRQQSQTSAQQAQTAAQQLPQLEARVSEVQNHTTAEIAQYKARTRRSPVQVGLRSGWSESPYAMPGGFFYGAFLNDRLLTEEDGVPFGDVTGELMAAVILGNHAVTAGNLASALKLVGPVSTSLTTIEIQPTVQYHANLVSLGLERLSMLEPYILAGPGIWISTMSTPVVNGSGQAGRRFRHSDADVQPGGVFGLGTNLKAGNLLHASVLQGILDKTTFGAEYRYNALANGEGFHQYAGTLAFGF